MNRMKNKTYWDDYYQFWDTFVQDWFQSGAKPHGETAKLYGEVVDFNADELPEPYLGDPKAGVDAVFLNLNPGMSVKGKYGSFKGKNLEATKYYSNLDKPFGWLIREFRNAANCSYKEHIKKWSCLNPNLRGQDPEVCGVDWWQGSDPNKVGGRMKWVRQIYGDNQLCPSRVFAPEICPFHSPRFPTNRLQNLTGFIRAHVIVPAARAVIENGLPFAVAVGKSYAEVLTALGARQEKEWSSKTPMKGWPKNQSGSPVNRTYGLFSFDVDGVGCARFLVTCAPGGNNPPRADFALVEAAIRQFATRHNVR